MVGSLRRFFYALFTGAYFTYLGILALAPELPLPPWATGLLRNSVVNNKGFSTTRHIESLQASVNNANDVSESDLGRELIGSVDRLAREVEEVYRKLVVPTWGGDLHGLPNALYGYMMGVFARIDLVSAHWRGTYKGDQTQRMVQFMDRYFGTNHEANSVAVQMWRHKLMHTAQPRYLRDSEAGILYKWLLHWGSHLPQEQHFTFITTGDSKILNLGLVYLIVDLRRAVERYRSKLAAEVKLQAAFREVEDELRTYELRPIASMPDTSAWRG